MGEGMRDVAARKGAALWPVIHEQRRALADDLDDLAEERWATPSLCDGLTVREVLAHLTVSGSLNTLGWIVGVIRCRFDFDRQVVMQLNRCLGDSPADTLAGFRRTVTSTISPPLPKLALLGEVLVHGEDIRRPLGIRHEHPPEVATAVADYYAGSDQVVVAKSRIRGLHLIATDGPFAVGAGPQVAGPTVDLVMAMTGRGSACDELTGDGVATLRERC